MSSHSIQAANSAKHNSLCPAVHFLGIFIMVFCPISAKECRCSITINATEHNENHLINIEPVLLLGSWLSLQFL